MAACLPFPTQIFIKYSSFIPSLIFANLFALYYVVRFFHDDVCTFWMSDSMQAADRLYTETVIGLAWG